MPTNAATKIETETDQTAMVAELVERTLSTIGHGRAIIVSLDHAQRIVGIHEIAMNVYARIDHAKWELGAAVPKRAASVVVGYPSGAPGEAERFARTIGSMLPAPIVEIVVASVTVRTPQMGASGWIRRSTVQSA